MIFCYIICMYTRTGIEINLRLFFSHTRENIFKLFYRTCGSWFSLSKTAEFAAFPPTRLITSTDFFRTSKTSCVVVFDEFVNTVCIYRSNTIILKHSTDIIYSVEYTEMYIGSH